MKHVSQGPFKRPNFMAKKCIGCKKPVEEEARICGGCRSSQNLVLFYLDTFGRFSSPLFATLSIIISGIAFYVSVSPPPPVPKISTFISDFRNDSFSYLVTNIGETALEVKSADLRISLVQRDTLFSTSMSYDLDEPIFLGVGESDRITFRYSELNKTDSTWTVSSRDENVVPEKLDVNFLNIAPKLGNNLHCEIVTLYTGAGYLEYINTDTTKSNGNCVPAMAFAATTVEASR